MRAFEILAGSTSIDGLRAAGRPKRTAAPRQILVRMQAPSLNYRDLMVAKGPPLAAGPVRAKTILLSDSVGERGRYGLAGLVEFGRVAPCETMLSIGTGGVSISCCNLPPSPARALIIDVGGAGTLGRSMVEPVVDRIFPFDQAAEAYRHLENGAHFGKVVVHF